MSGRKFLLILGNARSHASSLACEHCKTVLQGTVGFQPACSPDLSPLDFSLWNELKMHLVQHPAPASPAELRTLLTRVYHISPASLANAPPSPACARWSCSAPDARCLQSFANTGDGATWHACDGASDERCGTNAFLITATDPLTKRTNHAQFERCETKHAKGQDTQTSLLSPRGRPMLRDAMSPSLRSLCSHCCVVDSGTPSTPAIFLFRSLASPCAPWRNAPLWIAPCCENA